MATLGNVLLGALLGHTDAEKMFRPWWDSLEDFVIYGLIMLGLIVSPTTIFNGTPLVCTQCIKEGQCPPHPSSPDAPYQAAWVKSYCTMSSLTLFTLYFPYILLLSALALAGIEILFGRIFKANIQIEGFYSLLRSEEGLKLNTEAGEIQPDNMLENNIKTVEVRQSFKESSRFYSYYFLRTVLEFLLAAALALYMIFFGVREITLDKNVYCEVHSVWYECSGIPHQFYMSVLFVALVLLALYLFSTALTICWLICPFWGRLARLMRSYSNELQSSAIADGRDAKAKPLMGELYEIYYENKDLRLLLDLLAATSGLAPPLRVMALMDKKFRNDCSPIIHSLERTSEVVECESEVTLEFSESLLASTILSKIEALHLLYTVQIIPRTDTDSVEVVCFERAHEKLFSVDLEYFQKANGKNGHVKWSQQTARKKIQFCGVDADKTYTVIVTLVLNGRAIASSQKKLKAILPTIPEIQAAQALLASQVNLQTEIS